VGRLTERQLGMAILHEQEDRYICLFILGLLNDSAPSSGYIGSNDNTISELERKW
jgi:hypothetical protein